MNGLQTVTWPTCVNVREAAFRGVISASVNTLLITTRHEPISGCRKMPHIADLLSAAAASSPATSWADFTINTVGI